MAAHKTWIAEAAPSFARRPYDEQLLAELPASVDLAARTASSTRSSHAGPLFAESIACETGEIVEATASSSAT
jgi:hypothetical protein